MFSSFAASSSSLSIGAAKSTFTRWMGGIMRPELVKKPEMSSPRSARRAIASAETGRLRLRVLFIKLLLLFGGLPQSHQMVIFAFPALPDLEDDGVQSFSHPANRPMLCRKVRALVKVIWVRKDLLCFLKADTTLRVPP